MSVEKAQQRILVVAQQPDGREARQRIVEQTFDDAPAVRPTIDVVANEDQRARDILGMTLGIPGDERQYLLQEIEPTVDVADGVDGLAFG